MLRCATVSADARPEPGLRERKKRATRLALSRATIELTLERGWRNVTVDEIAAAAGVSERTFRNYFPTKSAAVAGLHLDRMEQIADDLRTRPAEEPLWEAISATIVARFKPGEAARRSAHDRQRVESLRLMRSEPALQGEIAKANATAQTALAAAIAERTATDPDRDLYPNAVAAVIAATTAAAVDHALRSDPPAPLEPLLRDVIAQVAAGLPAPRPARRARSRSRRAP